MNSIMLDLETMGNGSNAAIISIGAARFDTDTGITGTFHCRVSLASSIEQGGVVDASTVEWWMKQSDEARGKVLEVPRSTIEVALTLFSEWATRGRKEAIDEIWGCGATADNVWLTNAYRRAGLDKPWSYKADRCYRTIRDMFSSVQPEEFVGVQHDALDDAKNQASHLIKILNRIKRETPGV